MQTVFSKTALGHQAFKERAPELAGKMRSAFLLFDGQRKLSEVLDATRGLGVQAADIQALVEAGFLASDQPSAPELAPVAMTSERSPQERYRDAYPVAVALTGKMGLSGFRLNLSVEGSTNYEQLAAVAPKIKDAVGAKAYQELDKALFG